MLIKFKPLCWFRKLLKSERESIAQKPERLDFNPKASEEGVLTKRINYFYDIKAHPQEDYRRQYIERESIRRTPIRENFTSEESKDNSTLAESKLTKCNETADSANSDLEKDKSRYRKHSINDKENAK